MSSISENPSESQFDFPLCISPPEGGLIIYRAIQQGGCAASSRPMLEAFNADLQQVVYFRPLCKSWNCPYCAPRRATAWKIRAERGTEVMTTRGGVEFVTVTSHERLSPAASLAVLPKAWNKLNLRLKRAAENVEYFAVPEQHKDGRWHLHVIVGMSVLLKKKWWKDNARSCGLGYQSDVQEVASAGGVGNYVTKYLTKMLQNSNLPKGFRRVRLSHGWPQGDVKEKPDGWRFSVVPADFDLAQKIERQKLQGLTVVMSDGTAAWDWLENWSEL